MHRWHFFKSARCIQPRIKTGADLLALKDLDKKLWTVLSAPTAGLRFDAATLAFLDADGDGRIRPSDILAAIDWMAVRFKNLDFLFDGRPEIPLACVQDETPEGRALAHSFSNILLRAGKADASVLTLADVMGTGDVFNAQPFNGDGVVTEASTPEADLAAVIHEIAAAEGTVPDRSGEPGIDRAKTEAFFAAAAARLAWLKDGAAVAVKGEKTAAAYAALQAVEAPINAYFKPAEDRPLVSDQPDPVLPLTSDQIHPDWRAAFRTFAETVLESAEPLTRAAWQDVQATFAPYAAWRAAEAGKTVSALDRTRLETLLQDGAWHAKVNALIDKDQALEDEYKRFVDCERAIRYAAYLTDWLCNYVNQADLYDPSRDGVFRTGDLFIDGRTCRLCFHVAQEAAHAALAARSQCCLLYAKLTRPASGETREICAVVTAGTTAGLYAGRNGLFIDEEGREWEAVVVKVVEAQVSLREAFWAPWVKIGTTISEQCKKFLTSKQDTAVSQVGKTATEATVPPAKSPSDGANATALASSVAALGVGVGMAGAALGGLIGLVAGLPLWKVLTGIASVILIVSLPSVVLTWFKLRARDLGAILNAGGWAVNRPLTFSMGLARTFTYRCHLPCGALVARDPYAARGKWWWGLSLLLIAGALTACWFFSWPPFCRACSEPSCTAAPACPVQSPASGSAQ